MLPVACIIPGTLLIALASLIVTIYVAFCILTCFLPKRFFVIWCDFFMGLYERVLICFFHQIPGMQIFAYGDTDLLKKKENAIYICNHQSTADWLIPHFLSRKQGSQGHVRSVMKDGLQFLPFYGFFCGQRCCIYVKRGSMFDEAKFLKDIAFIKENNVPIWLVVFPDGTRYNPELTHVIERSKEYSRNKGLQELEHVLSPRTRGLHICINQLAGHVDAIYNFTAAFSNTKDSHGRRTVSPQLSDLLVGKSRELHLHMEGIDLCDVPKEEPKLHLWLHKQYERKDKMLKDFYSNDPAEINAGRFPGVAKLITFKLRETLPYTLFLVSCLFLILIFPESRLFYLKWCVVLGAGGCLWMAFRG